MKKKINVIDVIFSFGHSRIIFMRNIMDQTQITLLISRNIYQVELMNAFKVTILKQNNTTVISVEYKRDTILHHCHKPFWAVSSNTIGKKIIILSATT